MNRFISNDNDYDKFIKSIKSIMINWIKRGKNNKEFISYLRDRRVILISKNNMDIKNPLNYRPIAINNIFIRIFLKILLQNLLVITFCNNVVKKKVLLRSL